MNKIDELDADLSDVAIPLSPLLGASGIEVATMTEPVACQLCGKPAACAVYNNNNELIRSRCIECYVKIFDEAVKGVSYETM